MKKRGKTAVKKSAFVTEERFDSAMVAIKQDMDRIVDQMATKDDLARVERLAEKSLQTAEKSIQIAEKSMQIAEKSLRISESVLTVVESIDVRLKGLGDHDERIERLEKVAFTPRR